MADTRAHRTLPSRAKETASDATHKALIKWTSFSKYITPKFRYAASQPLISQYLGPAATLASSLCAPSQATSAVARLSDALTCSLGAFSVLDDRETHGGYCGAYGDSLNSGSGNDSGRDTECPGRRGMLDLLTATVRACSQMGLSEIMGDAKAHGVTAAGELLLKTYRDLGWRANKASTHQGSCPSSIWSRLHCGSYQDSGSARQGDSVPLSAAPSTVTHQDQVEGVILLSPTAGDREMRGDGEQPPDSSHNVPPSYDEATGRKTETK